MNRKCCYCNQEIDLGSATDDKSFKCPSCGFPNAATNTVHEENLKKLIPEDENAKTILIEKTAKKE